MKKRVLLLNPPGSRYYMRDYYCSKISKASYYYHPIDFVILSGILSDDFDLHVIDCIAERLDGSKALARIAQVKPDCIIFLSGSSSIKTDFPFLKKVKDRTGAKMIGIGDIFLDHGSNLMRENDFIDAVLLDFTTEDIKHFLNNDGPPHNNIICRYNNGILEGKESHQEGLFSIPMPRHELFKNDLYVFPFARKRRFATVLTNFGCPFKCSFCVVNRFGFKERPLSDVIEELNYLNSMDITEVVFKDQSFAARRESADLLCAKIISENIRIGWTCFSRIDLMDEPLLKKMKDAGCHTIIFGIESANPESLFLFNKQFDKGRVKDTIRLCKSLGIRTVGTFILGLPGEDRGSIEKTVNFAKESRLDYASFNIFTPAYGTEARNRLIQALAIDEGISFMDRSASYPIYIKGNLSQQELWSLRNYAIRRFYLDPAGILRKLLGCGSFFEFTNTLKQGVGIFKTLF